MPISLSKALERAPEPGAATGLAAVSMKRSDWAKLAGRAAAPATSNAVNWMVSLSGSYTGSARVSTAATVCSPLRTVSEAFGGTMLKPKLAQSATNVAVSIGPATGAAPLHRYAVTGLTASTDSVHDLLPASRLSAIVPSRPGIEKMRPDASEPDGSTKRSTSTKSAG